MSSDALVDPAPVPPPDADRGVPSAALRAADVRPPDVVRVVRQVVLILAGAAVFGAALIWLGGGRSGAIRGAMMVLLAVVSLLAGCWGAVRRWRDYTLPLRRLQTLLPKARAGEAAIEELTGVGGSLSPIIPELQDLLIELRRERMQNAVLQEEIRQRVMSRTDALERKIGSLQQQATRDGLTGLFNRRALDVQLPAMIEHCRSRRIDLCLLMIDVDHFKTLNDTLGHAAGDDLLRQIGQLIKSSVRENDAAFRCGGDEFVVVLPGAMTDTANRLADRLRSLVDAIGKTLRLPRAPRLSIGVAGLADTNNQNATELLALADKALYQIKSARPTPSRAA